MHSVSRLVFGLALLTAAILSSTFACAQEQATARGVAATCANCHGTDGRSVGALPGLAGVDSAYMIQQLRDFKNGKRPATIMNQLARGLSDAQIESVAGYFAAQRK